MIHVYIYIINKQIRKEQVQNNLMNAIEMIPEAFASVTMLYVNIAINNSKVN